MELFQEPGTKTTTTTNKQKNPTIRREDQISIYITTSHRCSLEIETKDQGTLRFHPEPNPGFHTVVLKLAQAIEFPERLLKTDCRAGLPESDARNLEGRLRTGTFK